jgi:hypothetical protein
VSWQLLLLSRVQELSPPLRLLGLLLSRLLLLLRLGSVMLLQLLLHVVSAEIVAVHAHMPVAVAMLVNDDLNTCTWVGCLNCSAAVCGII